MTWIQTRSATAANLLAPRFTADVVHEIAWSLSMICRFNGHTSRFYNAGRDVGMRFLADEGAIRVWSWSDRAQAAEEVSATVTRSGIESAFSARRLLLALGTLAAERVDLHLDPAPALLVMRAGASYCVVAPKLPAPHELGVA